MARPGAMSACVWLLWSAAALAQEPAASGEPPPQPPAADVEAPAALPPALPAVLPPPAAAEQPVPPPSAATVLACLPDCRSGFVCRAGQCVSVCNPPCSVGESCTAAGECAPVPPASVPRSDALPDSGVNAHDGFFLRMSTGLGGGGVGLDIPDQPSQTYTGGGWSISVDVGGAVTRDLVVFGRLRGAWLVSPAVRVGGEEIEGSDGRMVDQGLFGPGINYYVMPLNFYFGGALGVASVQASRTRPNGEEQRDSSRLGFGIDLDVGKEWWVSDNWGLGAAFRLSLASVPASEEQPRHSAFGASFFALLFSATYQ